VTDRRKTRKYYDIVSGVDFSPFATETSGVWGEHALDLVTEIGRHKAAMTRTTLEVYRSLYCVAMPSVT